MRAIYNVWGPGTNRGDIEETPKEEQRPEDHSIHHRREDPGYLSGPDKRSGDIEGSTLQDRDVVHEGGGGSAPASEMAVEHGGGPVESPGAKTDAGSRTGNPQSCVFALTFTESGRYGTLWSIRIAHDRTNYLSLVSLMQNIEKRQRAGEALAPNVPNLPRKTERSAASKVAFRYSIEVEDLYSIRYSSETAERLAGFYGLSVRDIRHIRKAEIDEGE